MRPEQGSSSPTSASRFADPGELAAEAKVAFGGPVKVARDLDAFDF